MLKHSAGRGQLQIWDEDSGEMEITLIPLSACQGVILIKADHYGGTYLAVVMENV